MKTLYLILCLILALLFSVIQQAFSQDIYTAVEEGNLQKVREYLEKDPGLLNQKNQGMLTPLNLAAERNQPEIAAFLLEKGADPNLGDRENSQPIHLAAFSGSKRITELLLEKGVDVDAKDINLMTPLLFAASRGHLEVATYLVDHGASVKAGNISGISAIHYAAISGNVDLVKMLVGKGAKVNARTDVGITPMHMAASYGKTDVVKFLAENGADIHSTTDEGVQPLARAIGINSYDAASYLISKGADVNHKDKNGFTALHDAAGRGNVRVTELLLDNGADINAATITGFVPLSYAAWPDNASEIGRFLILRGADVNPDPCANNKACTCGPNFQTPLHFACQMGKADLAGILLSNGAKVNIFNADGMPPLHCAVKSGNIEIVKMLTDHGAFLNVREKQQGSTELHIAAALGYGDIAAFLAEKGSCPEMKDQCGKTPLDYAFHYGQKQIGYEMLAAGGNDSLLAEYLTMECPMARQIPVGEAMVWFLGHSGWAIKTSDHFLVFDYFDNPRERKSDHPCLASGCINPADLKNQPLTVFSTHGHQDHYNPAIFNWKQENPDAKYILAFQPDQVSEEYTFIPVNTESEVDGMKIYVNNSTDQGGGFLVEVDGLVIFYMGDHANGEDELAADFTKEIDLIAEQNKKIDILFGPIRGCGLGTPEQVKKGTYYTLEKLDPALFVPMHSGSYSFEYKKFAEQAQKDGISQPMKYVMSKGDRFLYSKGERIVSK